MSIPFVRAFGEFFWYSYVVSRKPEEQAVEVLSCPDAPHLVGMQGVVAHVEGWVCVHVNRAFTHFKRRQLRFLGKPVK
jgi:hypothetical protein